MQTNYLEISNNHYKDLIVKLLHVLQGEFKLKPIFGFELEFYLISKDEKSIAQAIENIEKSGFKLSKERGWDQFEWSSHTYESFSDAIDAISQIKSSIIYNSHQNNISYSFDAKPFSDDYGSALQINLSLVDEGYHNIFSDNTKGDNPKLANVIAGILAISDQATYILCTDAKDYDRFTHNFMAPTKISWGTNNRSTLIRIPDTKPIDRRLEYRIAPANTNPHALIFVTLLGAYLGLKNNLHPGEPIFGNAYDEQYDLSPLPKHLDESKQVFFDKKTLMHWLTL